METRVGAPPDAVFTHFTDRFGDVWPGKVEILEAAGDPAEPNGLGMVRRIKPPGSGALVEEIVTHDRPSLIEYKVIDDDAPFQNHLGRIEFREDGGGTRIDYTISYDYRPSFLAPVTKVALTAAWRLHATRHLHSEFGG